jgi:hypothetical protein
VMSKFINAALPFSLICVLAGKIVVSCCFVVDVILCLDLF